MSTVKIFGGGQAGGKGYSSSEAGGETISSVPVVDVSAVESKVEREFKARYEAEKELSERAAARAHGKRVTVAVTEDDTEVQMCALEYCGKLYDIHGTPLPGNYYKKEPALGLAILCIFGLISLMLIVSVFGSGSW
jgi:hypothetical protein